MSEIKNLIATQPGDELVIKNESTSKQHVDHYFTRVYQEFNSIITEENTKFHVGISLKAAEGCSISADKLWCWIGYHDQSGNGNYNYANSKPFGTSTQIVDSKWTRLETEIVVPAGMTLDRFCSLSISGPYENLNLFAANVWLYPVYDGKKMIVAGDSKSFSPVNDGADGVSPTVSVSKSGGVTTISITDKNGTHTQTVNDGVDGTPGTPGADGKTPYFHVKYSYDGGKTFTANSGETVGTYIGTCTDYNSADPTSVGSYTWAKIKGDTGPGVSAIVEQYYLSTSSTAQTGGSWSTTSPAWQSGHYIWTRSQITWTTGTITYTTPVLAQAINSANKTADTALASANGKSKSYYQAAQPTGGKDGDLWFKLDSSGNAAGIYKYSGSKWVEMPIESSVIASLDAAKINAGTLNGMKIVGSTFVTPWKYYTKRVTGIDYATVYTGYSRIRITNDGMFFDNFIKRFVSDDDPTDSTSPTSYFKFCFGTDDSLWIESINGGIRKVLLDSYSGITTNGDIIPGKISGIANLIYPVGSIYMSMNSTNPSTLFGGTWEQIKDRFLLSAGDSYSAGSTGGQSNMHIQNSGAETSGYGLTPGSSAFANRVMVTDGNYTSDSNLPPYLTVYMWKRIA